MENAFKHGVSQQLDEAWIQVQLTAGMHELVFKVENSTPALTDEESVSGIGLSNIAKRMELIYPGPLPAPEAEGHGLLPGNIDH